MLRETRGVRNCFGAVVFHTFSQTTASSCSFHNSFKLDTQFMIRNVCLIFTSFFYISMAFLSYSLPMYMATHSWPFHRARESDANFVRYLPPSLLLSPHFTWPSLTLCYFPRIRMVWCANSLRENFVLWLSLCPSCAMLVVVCSALLIELPSILVDSDRRLIH